MKTTRLALIALALSAAAGSAQSASWETYRIPETGTSVDIPRSIFTEPAGKPDGYGERFRSADGRADLTVQTIENQGGDSPAQFLARKSPPANIEYKRVTPRFFAVSSVRGDRIWYNRCNFVHRYAHCVLINYPASEKRRWDNVVTRISLSLSGG